ncbi:hypothetical protein [Haloarchaeobius sp. TZWWS8]|uniref:hypothetical protein n=1 Tax=Haloarchaeobius sp. TZWWS8 TaxID=3446121 RepID=UPI003EBA9ECA
MPDIAGMFFGTLATGGGLLGYHYARPLSRFSEQLDAIGSTTDPATVEPAEWKVALNKLVSVVVALVGVFMFLASAAGL